jgi:hypothetical protein
MQIIKDSFTKIENSGDDGYFEILDDLLRSDYGTDMKEALLEFAKWVAYKDDYFEEGYLYPDVKKYKFSDKKAIAKGGVLIIDGLSVGWNMVSLPSAKVNDIQVDGLKSIWTYENSTWKNTLSYTGFQQISQTDINSGYWVDIDSDTSFLYFTGSDASNELDIASLSEGWHFVGGSKEITKEALSGAKIVWRYENGEWKAYSSNLQTEDLLIRNNYLQFDSVEPFVGYWILK